MCAVTACLFLVYLHDGENEPRVLPQAVARGIGAVLVVFVDGQQGHPKDHRHADVVEVRVIGNLPSGIQMGKWERNKGERENRIEGRGGGRGGELVHDIQTRSKIARR